MRTLPKKTFKNVSHFSTINTVAHAKINLGLNVTERRPDGYHNLESLFMPMRLCDSLNIRVSDKPYNTLTVNGLQIDGDVEDNLVMRASRLVETPPVHITLDKCIPTGAGLGGGSSDAAATLRGLNDLFELGLEAPDMRELLLTLGADCPFFVEDIPQFVEGIGEILTPYFLPLPTHGKILVLVKPAVSVSTREAYANIRPRTAEPTVLRALRYPLSEWRNVLHNDFEESVFAAYPEIRGIKEALYEAGAVYAQMSGSGSAVFGIFDEKPQLPAFPEDYFVWEEKI